MRKIALQLYTVRETIKNEGLIPVLKDVATIGYKGVEGGSFMGNMTARELRLVLNDLGLTFASGHVSIPEIQARYEQILEDYVTLGAGYVGLAWVGEEWRTDAGWVKAARIMEKAAMEAQKHGITFFYHNHDFEFKKTESGKVGMDVLFGAADPALVKSELDVFWVKKGGQDPLTYINKLDGRAPLLHIKDMTADESHTFEVVGDGIIDFDAVFKAGDAKGVDWYIVEQDLCPKGEVESARRSYQNIVARGWLG
jgi:sugar phosphate isomerase/epimerase